MKALLKKIAKHGGHGASFVAQAGDMSVSCRRPESYDCVKSIFGFTASPAAVGPLTISAEGLDLP